MDMIEHYDVGKDKESTRSPSLRERFTDYFFHLVSLEDRKPVMSDRRQVERGRGAGDLEHIVTRLVGCCRLRLEFELIIRNRN